MRTRWENIAFAIREALLSLSNFTDDSKILLHSFYLRNLTSSNSIHRLIKVGKNLLNQPRLIFTHKYTHTHVSNHCTTRLIRPKTAWILEMQRDLSAIARALLKLAPNECNHAIVKSIIQTFLIWFALTHFVDTTRTLRKWICLAATNFYPPR